MSKYTCISCRVAFPEAEIQRNHYKTDWHRYNLKRKVIDLPPVTAEEFQSRVLHQKAVAEEESRDDSVLCIICRKSFSSSKAFINHQNSKKHKLAVSEHNANSEVPIEENEVMAPLYDKVKKNMSDNMTESKSTLMDTEDDNDSDWEDIDSDCDSFSDEFSDDTDYDEVSKDNPILYHNCLFCNHHSATMTKNLGHMLVVHSFFLPDVEYIVDTKRLLLYLGEKICKYHMCLWCNLSGREFLSMEAAQTHMRDKGHCKMLHEGSNLAEYAPFYDYSTSYPDHDENVDADEPIDIDTLDGSDFQLTLPSGATVGHRSLSLYYRQRFNPNRELALKCPKKSKVVSTYRALGWKGSDKEAMSRRARDIQFISRVQAKYFQQLGSKSNKLQKHFRPQVNF